MTKIISNPLEVRGEAMSRLFVTALRRAITSSNCLSQIAHPQICETINLGCYLRNLVCGTLLYSPSKLIQELKRFACLSSLNKFAWISTPTTVILATTCQIQRPS